MSYLVNRSRGASITINGVDYTRNLLQINIADESVRAGGLLVTSGRIVLTQPFGEASIEDYTKTKFLRGHVVIINVNNPNGTIARHPRGYLYLVESSYDPEQNTLTLEVGCKLFLASLSDNVDNLINLTDIELGLDQRDYSTLSTAIQTESNIVYQDNYGNLQKINFFDGDAIGAAVAPGEWVSVFGSTTISVGPLGATTVVPDKIELTYLVANSEDDEIPNQFDLVETTSTYYLTYPATIWTRVRPTGTALGGGISGGGLSGISGTGTTSLAVTESRVSEECGSSPISPPSGPSGPVPEEPTGGGDGGTQESCSDGYETEPMSSNSAVTSIELSSTWYDAPGNQISTTKTEKWGPAVELNSQYYADLYAFCVWGFGTACTPSGNCPLTGLANVYHGYTQTTYMYGTGGEVLRTVTETYANDLSAAQASDWRSGVSQIGGAIEFAQFREIPTDKLHLSQRTTVDYEYYDNKTIETTTTLTAPTQGSLGVGISAGCYDATCGLTTVERRVSTTTNGPDAPDSQPAGLNVETISFVIDDVRSPVNYVTPPDETSPIIQTLQIDFPLASSTASGVASEYLRYQRKLIEGDSTGLRIVEALREDIITDWRPGMPFRYYDPRTSQLLALRMNACGWAMDPDECVVSTDGIFIGLSNGTVSEPSNLVGNEVRPQLLDAPLAVISAASITGTQLTVTEVQFGVIQVGSILSGEGIPSGTFVVSYLSGEGGTGTYTISESVSFFGTIHIYSTVPTGENLPTVEDETGMIGASFAEIIKVDLYLRSLFTTGGGDNGYGIISPPGSVYVDEWTTWTCFISGGIYAPGGLLSTEPGGGVPLTNGNVLMTSTAVPVNADVFA